MIVGFIIFCCWVVSFFFNGIESGLLSIDPVRFRQNLKRGVPAARRLDRLLKHPERLLATVLLFTNAADILGLLLLTRQLVRSYGNAGFLFALAIALPVYLFLLSVLPKSLFRRFPFRALARLAGSCRETLPAFCRSRRAKADRHGKRARRGSHRDRARNDP